MEGVAHLPGEGESLFGGRIVLKADFEELCMTESHFPDARPGAGPHLHRQHADSFYVLDGELAFLVDDEEVLLGPGACVCAPAGMVHGFRSTSEARFLNFHTPPGGFAENLRARDRGEPGGFDSVDVEPGSGLPGSEGVVVEPGGGERLTAKTRVATIKLGRDELALVEFELEPGFRGPPVHAHDDQLDSFYVLEGEAEFVVEDDRLLLGPGSFVAAPPGVRHTFAGGPGPSRVLNLHAPSAGFHEWLRQVS
jgi:quercetin dioxygenase-like cupin family protein